MAYNLSLEEYFQISQLGSDQPNHHPGTSTIQPPASRVEQSSALSTNWPLYDPSMNYGSAYVDPNWITYTTTIGEPIAESMYQGNIQPSSTTQAKAEDHPHPHQTTIQIQSPAFASSHSTRESSAPNENNVTRNEPQERDESDGDFKCLWDGCTRRERFGSLPSLIRHIKVQHGVRRSVRCPDCGQAFGRRDNMRDHRGRLHGMFD